MEPKFLKVIPQFDTNLAQYIDQVLAQFEGAEVEPDSESTDCLVLLLPCAGTIVKILVNLQTVSMVDIGFPRRPEFSEFVVTNFFETTLNSWDPANPESLAIIILRLKKALIEFYIDKIPRVVKDEISNAFSSCSMEVVGNENDPDKLFMLLRMRPDTSMIAKATEEKGSAWVVAKSLFFLDCNFELDIPTQVPTNLSLKPSYELENYVKNETLECCMDNMPSLLSYLKKIWSAQLTMTTCRNAFFSLVRQKMIAALRAVFGKQIIRCDRVNFSEATLMIRASETRTFLLEIKFEAVLNKSGTQVGQKVMIHIRCSESPDEEQIIELSLSEGMSFLKTPLDIAKMIATTTIPILIAT